MSAGPRGPVAVGLRPGDHLALFVDDVDHGCTGLELAEPVIVVARGERRFDAEIEGDPTVGIVIGLAEDLASGAMRVAAQANLPGRRLIAVDQQAMTGRDTRERLSMRSMGFLVAHWDRGRMLPLGSVDSLQMRAQGRIHSCGC